MPVGEELQQFFSDDLKQDPVVSQFYEKGDYQTVPDVLKGLAHAQQRLGSSIPLPSQADEAGVAKWREQHLPKLIQSKLIDAPAKAPDQYQIARPENLPENAWSDDLQNEFTGIAKKYGLSQEAVSDLIGLHTKIFGTVAEPMLKSRQEAEAAFTTRMQELGQDPGKVAEAAKRWTTEHVKDQEVLEKLSKAGLMDDPDVVLLLAEAGIASGAFDWRDDTGSGPGSQMDAEEQEIMNYMAILTKPDHPDYAKTNTAEINNKIDAYFKKKAGGAQYVIG